MQRVKDYMSGNQVAPPGTEAHSARDDLRHAASDIRHAGQDMALKTRGAAREVAAEARGAAREVAADARGAAHEVASEAKHGAMSIKQRLESTAEAIKARAATEAAAVRSAAAHAQERLRDEEERARRRIKTAVSTKSLANYHAPFYQDVGGEFDATFEQPSLVTKRLVLTTPDLFVRSRNASWTLSAVHEGNSSSGEQLVSSLRWADTLFAPQTRSVSVDKDPTGVTTVRRTGVAWRRPQLVELDHYVSLPIAQPWKGTMRVGAIVEDQQTKCSGGIAFKQSGNQWLGALKTRLPYLSVTSTLSSDCKLPERSFLSGALASTLFRDTARGSTLTGGLQVKSGKFNPCASTMPSSVASVAAKLEYDEPDFNIDAKVRAHNYTNTQTQAQGLKISNAYIRGLYCTNLGQYPRSAFGVTVGLIDGEAEPSSMRSAVVATEGSSIDAPAGSPRTFRPYHDPDAPVESSWRRLLSSRSDKLAALDQPVASFSFYHALNAFNKVKLSATSARTLTSTFTYQLTDNVQVQSTFNTQLPSWDPRDVIDSAAGGVKSSLGLSVTIGAY